MNHDFWEGVAAVPVVAVAGFGLFLLWVVLLSPVGVEWADCDYCNRWHPRPKRLEPWWVWKLRKRISFARHMKRSGHCRERVNAWRLKYGDGKQW